MKFSIAAALAGWIAAAALAVRSPSPPATSTAPPVASVDASVTSHALAARVAVPRASCPEAVTPSGAHGEPRNAAGKVRYCWPGEARCHCDRDRDCYALDGYVPCLPVGRDAGPADTGPVRDAGRLDAGRDAGRDVGAAPPAVDAGTAPPPPNPAGLRAFPGAEGFGAGATGGRGGRVLYVTTLASSGPGSLQDAVGQTGPRTVVFAVSGVIDGDVQILHGDLTIAGQTSPGGIIVRGLHTTENPYCDQQCGAGARGVENLIVRHLRSRPAGGGLEDALRLRYVRNAVLDHLSLGNARDEAVEVSYANNVTVQDCLLAETVGDHAQYGGMLLNYTNPAAGYALDNLTIARNVWNRLLGRLPEMSRESAGAAAGTTLHIELTNNLLWDDRYFIDINPTDISGGNDGRPIFYALNWVGNWAQAPAGSHFGMIWLQSIGSGTSAYFNDNRMNLWPSRQDWDLNYCCNDYSGGAGERPSWARSTRHPFPAVTVMPSASVRAYALANVGAFPRDPMDRRLLSFVAAGTLDPRPINANPAGDALLPAVVPAPTAPLDTDRDGMPDAWELAHGLDPAVPDPNGLGLSLAETGVAGYTNLEVYLNALAAQRVAGGR